MRVTAARTVRRVLRDLLAGVLITVALAYATILIYTPAYEAYSNRWSDTWLDDVPASWPDEPAQTTVVFSTYNYNTASLGRWAAWFRVRQGMHVGGAAIVGNKVAFYQDQPEYVLDQIYVGWPLSTMTHRGPDDARPDAASSLVNLILDGIEIPTPYGPRRFPLQPIWWKFGLNVVFYAGLFEALLCVKRSLEKRIARKRRSRGLCTSCRYELKGLDVCPECGASSS